MLNISYEQGKEKASFFQQSEYARKLVEQALPLCKKWLGSLEYPQKFKALRVPSGTVYQKSVDALANFADYIKQQQIDNIVHLGIGGSILGPELVYDVLAYKSSPIINAYFFSSFDARLEKLLPNLNLAKTVFVVVSKSFTTDEVLWQWQQVENYLQQKQQTTHTFAITSHPEKAITAGFEAGKVLTIPQDVGGRFSVWSVVSASIVGAFGLKVFKGFLAGASEVDAVATCINIADNTALKMALQAYDCLQNHKLPTRAICAYHPALAKLVSYLQQLEMESLGKQVGLNNQAIAGLTCAVIWGGVGTNLQHSVFQYIMQGTIKTPIDFISIDSHDKMTAKYQQHLSIQAKILENGYNASGLTDIITPNPFTQYMKLQDLSAKSLGALLAIYEYKVIWLAAMFGLDPFTQPGVQAAKNKL